MNCLIWTWMTPSLFFDWTQTRECHLCWFFNVLVDMWCDVILWIQKKFLPFIISLKAVFWRNCTMSQFLRYPQVFFPRTQIKLLLFIFLSNAVHVWEKINCQIVIHWFIHSIFWSLMTHIKHLKILLSSRISLFCIEELEPNSDDHLLSFYNIHRISFKCHWV